MIFIVKRCKEQAILWHEAQMSRGLRNRQARGITDPEHVMLGRSVCCVKIYLDFLILAKTISSVLEVSTTKVDRTFELVTRAPL